MIAAWMLFTVETSLLLLVAALLAERAWRAVQRPARLAWISAMLGSALIPLTAWFVPLSRVTTISAVDASIPSVNVVVTGGPVLNPPDVARPSPAPSEPHALASSALGSNVFALPASIASQLEVKPNSALQPLDSPLLIAWLIVVALAAMVCLFAVARTVKQRAHWTGEYVDGTPVLVTHDVGPALIGVLQYSIVVPRWVLALEEQARKLILAHEREHARSYDPLLLACGVLLVVIAPWNVVNWLMLRRLRLAVEMDCDQRVLRAHPDSRGYSSLLLDVAERTLPSAMPQAALVEYGTSLETRIRAMISPSARYRVLRVGGNLLAVGALIVVACVTPRPYASLPPAERVARLRVDLAKAEASEKMALMRADSTGVNAMHNLAQVSGSTYPPGFAAIRALDSTRVAERAHDKALLESIKRAAPQALGRWPRQDSVLFIVLNSDGTVAKHFARAGLRSEYFRKADNYLSSAFFLDVLQFFDTSGTASIESDASGREFDVPLRVVWARLVPGATAPRTRFEIVPTRLQMIATLHKTHPEIFLDTSSNPLIGTLLYSTDGELLATSAVHSTEPRKWPDGQDNREFDRTVFRAAFGKLMDLGPIVENGAQSYLDDESSHNDQWRLMYAVLYKRATPNTGSGMLLDSTFNMTSAIRYRGPQPRLDGNVVNNRLLRVALRQVPLAFTGWSRRDSALFMVFDADDNLAASGAGPIAQSGYLDYVIGLLKSRMSLPPALDFTVVDFQRLQ